MAEKRTKSRAGSVKRYPKKTGLAVKAKKPVSREQLIRILEEWRAVFDTLTDAVVVFSPDGKIMRCNRSMAKFLNRPFTEIIGRDFTEVLSEIAGFLEILKNRTQRTTNVLEFNERWYHVAADPLKGKDGKFIGWDCIISDINDKKKTEDLLRDTNRTLEALIQASPLGIITFDRKGRIQLWNPAAEKIFGFSLQEVVGNLLPFVSAGKVKEAQAMLRAIATGREFEGVYRSWKRKDGRLIDVRFLSAPIQDQYGRIQSFIGIVADVTEPLRMEENLRQSEERFRRLFDESPLGIAIFRRRSLLYANRACLKVFGYASSDPVVGTSFWKYLTSSSMPLVRQVVKELKEKASGQTAFEITACKKDGTHFPIYVEVGGIVLPDGPAEVAFIVDLSERKLLEEKLVQAQKMESLGQLAAGVSHDFNNILTGIMGYADMALMHAQKPHPQYDALERIRQLSERAASITRKLLAFSRKQILEPCVLNLNSLVSDFMKLLGKTLGENIEIQFEPDLLSKPVRADASQLEQVLMNLCLNARDAMPGGGKLKIRTKTVDMEKEGIMPASADKPGLYTLLEVEDTGCGMSHDVMAKVFEPFFTTKEPGKGTGLGLAMVHGIVVQQGGFIDLESEPGKGSVFRIYLPAVTEPLTQTYTEAKRPMTKGGETVLVVEDDDDVREYIVSLLRELGYRIIVAREGAEGLKLFLDKRQEISLVISDLVMPKFSGQQLKEKILAGSDSRARILFISGYSARETAQNPILNGADFLPKPFTPTQLATKVRDILDRV